MFEVMPHCDMYCHHVAQFGRSHRLCVKALGDLGMLKEGESYDLRGEALLVES